jgi:hypothetical protein
LIFKRLKVRVRVPSGQLLLKLFIDIVFSMFGMFNSECGETK